MAKKKEVTCSCGAAFDSDGVCTRCGKKKPRSGGYRVLHGFLCVLGTLALLSGTTNTLVLREDLKTGNLISGLRASRLSDASVPFAGSVTEIIQKQFVNDPAILDSDIASAIDGMELPAYTAGKLETHYQMLRGTGTEPMQITPDELAELLESNKDALRQSCMLIIEDSDIEALRSGTKVPLGIMNGWNRFFGGNAAGRAISRFFVSIPGLLLELVLLGLLLWRWMTVRKSSGKDPLGAVRGMGRTIMIPATICFVVTAVSGIVSLFAKDGVTGLNPLLRNAALPVGLTLAMEASAGLLMLSIGKYLAARAESKAAAPAAAAEEKPTAMPELRLPGDDKTAVEMPGGVPFEIPVPQVASTDETKTCISCGKELNGKSKFCIYCGTNQETGGNVIDEVLASADDTDLPDNTEPEA